MTQFVFRGTVALDGVLFFIEADTAEQAKAKAKAGQYDEYETAGASTTDCSIVVGSCEEA